MAIYAGLQANGQYVEPLAAKYGMAAITWDPAKASSTQIDQTSYTSGTLYFEKLIYPMDRITTLGRYFGSTAWAGHTSLGFVVYSTDGVGSDITTLTKVATFDLTSSAGIGGNTHNITTVTGLTPGNAVYVAFLQVGATAGSMRQDVGGGANITGSAGGPNTFWGSGQPENWATSSAANTSGLTALSGAASTVAASTLVGSTAGGWPCIGLRP